MLHRTFRPHIVSPAPLPLEERMPLVREVTGAGVTIAFIDSGFFPHPDIRSRVLAHVDATDLIPRISNHRYGRPRWYAWHGQMTSVIACGNGAISGGRYRGPAPDAALVLIKVSTRARQIKEPDILRGLRWVADNARRYGIRIVNVSVGGDLPSDNPAHPLHEQMRALEALGVLVVCAAGNGGRSHVLPPASAPTALTVGGYDDRSSPDPAHWQPYPNDFGIDVSGAGKPDILGPARWVVSPLLPGSTTAQEGAILHALLEALETDDRDLADRLLRDHAAVFGLPADASLDDPDTAAALQAQIDRIKIVDAQHQFVDGTSVSAAVVSAVAAQLVQVRPGLTPAGIRRLLCETAAQFPQVPRSQQGAGVIMPAFAVEAARKLK
jgi:serine protease AprX